MKHILLSLYLPVLLLIFLLLPYICKHHESKQTQPDICTSNRQKSIVVEQKPLGSTRDMLPVQSACCYHGNNWWGFEHDDCKMTTTSLQMIIPCRNSKTCTECL